jgi:hypothetical protein
MMFSSQTFLFFKKEKKSLIKRKEMSAKTLFSLATCLPAQKTPMSRSFLFLRFTQDYAQGSRTGSSGLAKIEFSHSGTLHEFIK